MQDHPGFNGFAQTHFICQQYARRMTATHIVGDVELMRDQAGALAAQTAPWHAVLFTLKFTCAVAQRKPIHAVNLTSKQAILRFAERQFAVEQDFTQCDAGFFGIKTGTNVGKQTIFFFYFIDLQLPAFMAGNGIARVEHHAGHGGVTARIQTVFTGGGEKQSDGARIHGDNGSKSQFAFCIAYPALTKCKRHICSALYL